MTPSERERRIEAGALAWVGRVGQAWTASRMAALILDAAAEAVPVVSEAEMQRRSRIDHEAAEREHERAERAEAAARDFAKALREIEDHPWKSWHRITATRALNDHPSFSGEEGTEG